MVVDARAEIRSFGPEEFGYVLSTEVGMSCQVAKLPYRDLMNTGGEIAARGLTSNHEHLESLFEACATSTKEHAHAGQMAG